MCFVSNTVGHLGLCTLGFLNSFPENHPGCTKFYQLHGGCCTGATPLSETDLAHTVFYRPKKMLPFIVVKRNTNLNEEKKNPDKFSFLSFIAQIQFREKQ